MVGPQYRSLGDAISDFRAARSKAALRETIALIRRDKNRLLSYDEVRQKLKVLGASERGLQDIPLDAIVGSVGRYTDFTRDFLPRESVNAERWARVKLAINDPQGLPPIDVYQIGEAYFVKDGNHRVSVARELGFKTIQAYVTEVRTRVPLTPDVDPDDLILKSEYADFLEQTHLDELRPDAGLEVTAPGKYQELAEHIAVHRYFMGLDFKRDIPWEEAVAHWYDTVYQPVVRVIRELDVLRYFPRRTETDLYLWIAEHRAAVEESLGFVVTPESAATDLVDQFSPKSEKVVARLGDKLLGTIALDKLETGPPPGAWRKRRGVEQPPEHLFPDIMIALSGEEPGWLALRQALQVAQRESASLHGLHVLRARERADETAISAIRERFEQMCAEAGVQGDFTITRGDISREICSRARFTDLLVASLSYPPGDNAISRFVHGFRDLIRRCPLPLLAVPGEPTPLLRPLLAYDGSPKSDEALFIATYLAGQWQAELTVVTVAGAGTGQATLDRARGYIESHGLQAEYVLETGKVAPALLSTCTSHGNDAIVIGGYGIKPVLDLFVGSLVDRLLRESKLPMFICR